MPVEAENTERLQTIGQVVNRLSREFPDVTHSSLRFLEREGFIEPERTSGGHRLFQPDQVERIRLIKKWQRQRLSLEEIKDRLASIDQLPDPKAISGQLLELLISGDQHATQQLVLQADDAGVPLSEIFDEIIRPALHETGERWISGEITIGQEKEISAFIRDLIAHLGLRHQLHEQSDGPAVIAACVEGENHELGLRMITALLRREGYLVYYLGPSVSREFLIERVAARRPAAVLLAASRSELLPALDAAISGIRNAPDVTTPPTVIVGGAGVSEDWTPGANRQTVVVAEPDLNGVLAQINRILRDAGDLG